MFNTRLEISKGQIIDMVKEMVSYSNETLEFSSNENSVTISCEFSDSYTKEDLERIEGSNGLGGILGSKEKTINDLSYVRHCTMYMLTANKLMVYIVFNHNIILIN